MTRPAQPDPERAGTAAALAKVLGLLVLIVAANHAVVGLTAALQMDLRPSNEDVVHRLLMVSAGAYTLALATPYVPGLEIGLGLLALFGGPIVPLVYACTVAGLCLAFAVGRLLPVAALIRLARDLRMRRAAALLQRFDAVPAAERLAFLTGAAPGRWWTGLVRHRYLALALLLNLPGNFLLGGGGGIALLAGASRLFDGPWFVVTVTAAVAPVPLAVLVFGSAQIF